MQEWSGVETRQKGNAMSQGYEYLKVDIKCPFFKNIKKGTTIICEGPYDGCTGISLSHETKGEMDKQRKLFCCDRYQNCEIYRMIMAAKY